MPGKDLRRKWISPNKTFRLLFAHTKPDICFTKLSYVSHNWSPVVSFPNVAVIRSSEMSQLRSDPYLCHQSPKGERPFRAKSPLVAHFLSQILSKRLLWQWFKYCSWSVRPLLPVQSPTAPAFCNEYHKVQQNRMHCSRTPTERSAGLFCSQQQSVTDRICQVRPRKKETVRLCLRHVVQFSR